jgi:hypothetical protein
MIIPDANDNKHLYEDVFKDYYQWGKRLRLEGLPASQFGPKLCPFIVTHTTDMKAARFLSSRGGGCKNKTMFAIYVRAQMILSLPILLVSFVVITVSDVTGKHATNILFVTV